MTIESPEGLHLYKFQIEGVIHIEKCNGRALIADEMGLGKTIQALAWLRMHKNKKRPVIVVCPSSLKYNWEDEAKKWLRPGNDIEILSGKTPDVVTGEFVIINYDILHYWLAEIIDARPRVLIVDEAQYVKNGKANRSKAVAKLARAIPNVIGLSGTPIENKPFDIYNIVNIINNTIFPNEFLFKRRYCKMKQGYGGHWVMTGASKTEELHRILTSSVMIRRKKEDVLKDLPPKQIVTIPLSINNSKEYRKAEQEFIQYVAENFEKDLKNLNKKLKEETAEFEKAQNIKVDLTLSKSEIQQLTREKIQRISKAPTLAKIETLKQIAAQGKIAEFISWVKDFLESGEKLVIFAVHKKIITQLENAFPKIHVKVDGSVKGIKRQEAKNKFQTDPNVKLFIGNIKAAGVGLTLTAASKAAIIEFPWNPGELSQAGDRIHRITQTKKVFIYRFVAHGTIEEKILRLLNEKEKVIGEILDGKEIDNQSILQDLVKLYFQKPQAVKKSYKPGTVVELNL